MRLFVGHGGPVFVFWQEEILLLLRISYGPDTKTLLSVHLRLFLIFGAVMDENFTRFMKRITVMGQR